ncbi:MAG: 5'/3'-nucleotidase SurE [Dehalococcoidia bacterium]|nr:5'/3'-nucleotidase SurE [Dehalococcoidia bacterium]
MKILVTNDDGIDALGLQVLARSLQKAGQVIVIAPKQEQSGVGTSISLHQSIKINKLSHWGEGIEAYSVEGTPSDSVIIAIQSLFPEEINLVVSGINRGANMGHDVFVSGTVGAALQGYLHGISSIAISMNAYSNLNFDAAAKLASLLAIKIRDGVLCQEILLNINLPDLPPGDIAGIEITRLSKQNYCDRVEKDTDNVDAHYHIMRNNKSPSPHDDPKADFYALQQNKISITSLPDSSVNNSIQHSLKQLTPIIYNEFRNYTS